MPRKSRVKNYTQYDAEHPVVQAAVERLKALACNGRAPSREEYDANRGTCKPAATLAIHGWSWNQLVDAAGLVRRQSKPSRQHPAGDVPAHLEAEIRAAFDAQSGTQRWLDDHPLVVIPTRIEVRDIPQPDGSVYRVTRYHASIR